MRTLIGELCLGGGGNNWMDEEFQMMQHFIVVVLREAEGVLGAFAFIPCKEMMIVFCKQVMTNLNKGKKLAYYP